MSVLSAVVVAVLRREPSRAGGGGRPRARRRPTRRSTSPTQRGASRTIGCRRRSASAPSRSADRARRGSRRSTARRAGRRTRGPSAPRRPWGCRRTPNAAGDCGRRRRGWDRSATSTTSWSAVRRRARECLALPRRSATTPPDPAPTRVGQTRPHHVDAAVGARDGDDAAERRAAGPPRRRRRRTDTSTGACRPIERRRAPGQRPVEGRERRDDQRSGVNRCEDDAALPSRDVARPANRAPTRHRPRTDAPSANRRRRGRRRPRRERRRGRRRRERRIATTRRPDAAIEGDDAAIADEDAGGRKAHLRARRDVSGAAGMAPPPDRAGGGVDRHDLVRAGQEIGGGVVRRRFSPTGHGQLPRTTGVARRGAGAADTSAVAPSHAPSRHVGARRQRTAYDPPVPVCQTTTPCDVLMSTWPSLWTTSLASRAPDVPLAQIGVPLLA